MKQLQMKQKNKKVDFFGMLLGSLRTSLLENLLSSKGVKRPSDGVIRIGEETNREGQDF